MGPVERNHSSIGSCVGRPRQPTDDRIAVSMVPSCVYDTCVAKVYRRQRRQREGIPSDRCSMTGLVWHTLFWGPSCVCVTGIKRRVFACDNDVSRWRDGETDRNVIDVDRGQAWVLGGDVKVLKPWQHKENQLTAVKDVAAPAPPPEPPPTPK